MEVIGNLVVIVKAFVIVCFIVIIQIMQLHQLVTAGHIDFLIDNFRLNVDVAVVLLRFKPLVAVGTDSGKNRVGKARR